VQGQGWSWCWSREKVGVGAEVEAGVEVGAEEGMQLVLVMEGATLGAGVSSTVGVRTVVGDEVSEAGVGVGACPGVGAGVEVGAGRGTELVGGG
jgi:hypothetical protein